MKSIVPADRTRNVHYAIRDLAIRAAEYEKAGVPVSYFNIGDPAIFGFRPPKHVLNAAIDAIRRGDNQYVDSKGLWKARESISNEARSRGIMSDPEHVIITSGGSEGLDLGVTALVNRGEEVLVPMPGYSLYPTLLHKLEARPVGYRTVEEKGWQPDIEDIKRKVTPDTRAIIVNNPNNPTGAVYPRDTLKEIIGIAREKNMVILTDEVYHEILFDGAEHVPIASIAEDTPVVTYGGLSKNGWSLPGWRIGWMIFSNTGVMDEYREATEKLARARICAPGPFQYAIKPALEGNRDHLNGMNAELEKRRNVFIEGINRIPGYSCVNPQGAFYAFPRMNFPVDDDKKFVLDLLEQKHILFVHGSGFGHDDTQHFRAVLLPEPEVIEQTLVKLRNFSKGLYVGD
jgi:alanine-synthesizing transaminase